MRTIQLPLVLAVMILVQVDTRADEPKTAAEYVKRGNHHRYWGEDGNAIADFTEALRLDPKNGLALSGRGVSYDSDSKVTVHGVK